MKYTYSAIRDKMIARRLLAGWQQENTDDIINIPSTAKTHDFYYVMAKSVIVGWVATSSNMGFKCLSFMLINQPHRGQGHMQGVMRDAKDTLSIEALLASTLSDSAEQYEAKYAAAGYPEYAKMMDVATGHVFGEFYCVNEFIGLTVSNIAPNLVMLTRTEMDRMGMVDRAAPYMVSAGDIAMAKLQTLQKMKEAKHDHITV